MLCYVLSWVFDGTADNVICAFLMHGNLEARPTENVGSAKRCQAGVCCSCVSCWIVSKLSPLDDCERKTQDVKFAPLFKLIFAKCTVRYHCKVYRGTSRRLLPAVFRSY